MWNAIAGVRFVMTNGGRSGATLLQDEEGYTFSFSRLNKFGDVQRWLCSRTKRLKCKAYAKVDVSVANVGHGHATVVHQHCHPPFMGHYVTKSEKRKYQN